MRLKLKSRLSCQVNVKVFITNVQHKLLIHTMTTTPTIDFRRGEAIATCDILIELSKHREPPLLVMGSQVASRPTINVTLTRPINENEQEAVKRGYKTGRSITIQGRCNQHTDHFKFEWIAGRPGDEE